MCSWNFGTSLGTEAGLSAAGTFSVVQGAVFVDVDADSLSFVWAGFDLEVDFAVAFGFGARLDFAFDAFPGFAVDFAAAPDFVVALAFGLRVFALAAAFVGIGAVAPVSDMSAPVSALTVSLNASLAFEKTPPERFLGRPLRIASDFFFAMAGKSLDFAEYSHIKQQVVYVFLLCGQ